MEAIEEGKVEEQQSSIPKAEFTANMNHSAETSATTATIPKKNVSVNPPLFVCNVSEYLLSHINMLFVRRTYYSVEVLLSFDIQAIDTTDH